MRRFAAVLCWALLAIGCTSNASTSRSEPSERSKTEFVVSVVQDKALRIYDTTSVLDDEMIRLGLLACDKGNGRAVESEMLSSLRGKVKWRTGGLAGPVADETVGIVIAREAQVYLCR